MQTLNLQVTVPETHVIITRDEYDAYLDYKEQLPVNMTITEAAQKFGCSVQWFKQHVTEDDYFRRKLAPFTKFPKNKKGAYWFNRKAFLKFLDEYGAEILKRSEWN